MKQCNECGCYDMEFEGCGTDEYGEFEEYICNGCGETTRYTSR